MGRIGAHMSIAGGVPCAVRRAVLHGCEALQIFSKSANQWRARPLPAQEIAAFRAALAQQPGERARDARQGAGLGAAGAGARVQDDAH